ncbi:MAG: hypothetical protein MUF39_09720 [Cyclobacteriaceae bacterium]|nr:hypothetical protein [Cyclobacteriaceae bacterium]
MKTRNLFFNPDHLLLLVLLFFIANNALAQETAEEEFKPKIRGAIMMANSHVPKSFEGDKKIAIIPTWGVDVDYFFHPRWSVAIQSDIKLQDFEVKVEDKELERINPVALAGVIHYHALRHWSFYVGPGIELEKSENLFLVRAGTEYSFEISEDFEIALNLLYENKDDVYDTWTFGIAFNKKLWQKK